MTPVSLLDQEPLRDPGRFTLRFPAGSFFCVPVVRVFRFQLPPVEPDVRFSLIRLTVVLHRQRFGLGADTVPASLTSPSRFGDPYSTRRPNHRPRRRCFLEMNSTRRSVRKCSRASKDAAEFPWRK